MTANLLELFDRDLVKLKSIDEDFSKEERFWNTPEGITNSAGHLTLHLCGNLRHFIGHVIGGTSYVRDRISEFSSSPISTEELLNLIDVTRSELKDALSGQDEEDLEKAYPIVVFKETMSYRSFLLHLYGHLNYHLGQIQYLQKLQY